MSAETERNRARHLAGPSTVAAWVRRLAALLLLAFASSQSVAQSAADMSHADILGLRVGMTGANAEAVIASLSKVVERKELGGREGQTRRIYINFNDERALFLNFDTAERGGRLAELTLTLQGRSYRPRVGDKFEKKYGRPTQKVIDTEVRIFIWGGSTRGQDSVAPERGVRTTLRIDEYKQSTTIALVGHN